MFQNNEKIVSVWFENCFPPVINPRFVAVRDKCYVKNQKNNIVAEQHNKIARRSRIISGGDSSPSTTKQCLTIIFQVKYVKQCYGRLGKIATVKKIRRLMFFSFSPSSEGIRFTLTKESIRS